MRAISILAGMFCLPWGGLLWIGARLVRGVAAQRVQGYPNSAQNIYYIDTRSGVSA